MKVHIKPLKIAYTIQNVGGIDFNMDIGDTVPVKNTLRGLIRNGHEVVCLQLDAGSVRIYHDILKPDQYRDAPTGLSGKKIFKIFERIVRRLQRDLKIPYFAFFDSYRFYEACIHVLPNYSICHEHNGLFCIGAALACKRLGKPYVLTFSADPLFERQVVGKPLGGFHSLVATWEARYTYRLAQKIICVSKPARQRLIETWNVDPDKVVVMPNGVDSELFHPDYDPQPVRDELGLKSDPVVGFLGGFQPWHGIEILVESMASVHPKFPNAKLLLIGDGRARPSIERKIDDLNLRSSIRITGLVPIDQAPRYLAVVDVAVLPYPHFEKELWFSPLKLYEYMAAGKAIVASRAGQIAEVLIEGQTGLLVEPGDVNGLATAIMSLLDDPDRRSQLGQKARNQAIEQHSWDQYISRLEEIYLSVT